MAHKPIFGDNAAGVAVVIGTALLGSTVLFAVLYLFSVYVWR